MKYYLFLLFFGLNCLLGSAQSSISFGPQLSAGSNTKENGVGVGVSAEATIAIFQNGAIRFVSGYTQFPTRVGFVPIRVGYQNIFFRHFLAIGDIGTGTFLYPGYNYTRLSYGIGAGYRLPVANNFVQLSVIYEHSKDNFESHFAWVNYRIAYGINLKKKT